VVMTLKSSQLCGNDSTTEKPVRWGTNLDEREERKGTIMDHMTFTTIFSLLTTVAMVLLIMWGMSNVDPQDQREAARHPVNLPARGKTRVRRIRHKIPSGKGGTNDVPTLRWIDGA
jgi:hypothetical protein